MSVPRSVVILGDKISVKQASAQAMANYEEAGEDVLGLALLLEDSVLIRADAPSAYKKKILAHEIFHLACFKSGISQSINSSTEESLCQLFSQLYFQLKKQGL